MKCYIKNKKRLGSEFQFFMHDFVDACIEYGIPSKPDIFPWYKFHIRALLKHSLFYVYAFLHDKCHHHFRRKHALIVTANGVTIKDMAFPYYGSYEIIPMLWDVWPSTWDRMFASFRRLDIKLAFVTSKQVADLINQKSNVKAIWIPEGINEKLYSKGEDLAKRHYEIFEMGRRMPRYHQVIDDLMRQGKLTKVLTSNLHPNGTLDEHHVKYTNEELYRLMADAKVMVCFPQCDTNPSRGGNIETLTLRYWEAMLSRCLMIGRAPKELIDLIGYNPVIEVDWNDAEAQLIHILHHIDKFQQLVDKNLIYAKKMAPWKKRIAFIEKNLIDNGYYFS